MQPRSESAVTMKSTLQKSGVSEGWEGKPPGSFFLVHPVPVNLTSSFPDCTYTHCPCLAPASRMQNGLEVGMGEFGFSQAWGTAQRLAQMLSSWGQWARVMVLPCYRVNAVISEGPG